MAKAIFFDRDATLIHDKHYMHNPKDIEYFDDTFSTLKSFQDAGYLLFIITNQSGIGRGMFTEEDMHRVHDKMLADFNKQGIKISAIKFCPHAPDDGCDCRKPHPKMILELIKEYDIEKSGSCMIGDKDIDAQAGINAGINGVVLGKSENHLFYLTLTDFLNTIL